MSDSDEIRNMIAEYCLLADAGEFEPWSKMFTDEGTVRIGDDVVATGPDALCLAFQSRPIPPGNHLVSNLSVVVDGDCAKVKSNFIFVASADKVIRAVGAYLAEFVRADDGWKIADWQIRHW